MSITEHIDRQYDGRNDSLDEEMLSFFRKMIESQSNATYIMNPKRLNEFTKAYKVCQEIFGGSCEVIHRRDEEVVLTTFDIVIRGKSIPTSETKRFVEEVLRVSDGFDILGLTNGNIEFSISFNRMMVRGK